LLVVADSVPVGLYRTRRDGGIIGGNQALMKILGYPDRDTLLASNVQDHYVNAADRDEAFADDSIRSGAWHEIELVRCDGTVIWVRDSSTAVLDEDGELLHFDGVLEDVTEQRRGAKELEETTELFRAAFEDAPFGMGVSTHSGRIVRVNLAAAEMLGYTTDELVGMHFTAVAHPDDMEVVSAAVDQIDRGEVVRFEKRLVRRDGGTIWVLMSLAPVSIRRDGRTLLVAHLIDITERKQAREALEELIKSKDELVASVSHELRTPLTVVHGLAQELEASSGRFTVEEQHEFITMISEQSADVVDIVEDLLVAARADTGKLPLDVTDVDIPVEVDRVIRELRPTFDIRVEAAEPLHVLADGGRLRQVLRNLLTNADRYGGRDVAVSWKRHGGVASVMVTDDGPGVPMADRERVFDAYHRAHGSRGRPSSVGLGLTVSRKLVRLMGGDLTYRYEDGRSIFELTLPDTRPRSGN